MTGLWARVHYYGPAKSFKECAFLRCWRRSRTSGMCFGKILICIGNHMISSAICNKQARGNFSKTNKIARVRRASAICGLWKIYKCSFIPNCTKKIMWLLINNICEKISRWLSRSNARVSRNQGKIAPSIAPSRGCAWFENKRFDWPSVSFWSLTNQNAWFVSSFCTELTLFCTV